MIMHQRNPVQKKNINKGVGHAVSQGRLVKGLKVLMRSKCKCQECIKLKILKGQEMIGDWQWNLRFQSGTFPTKVKVHSGCARHC